jgi:DNA-binding beta-propeller fold protein YncE
VGPSGVPFYDHSLREVAAGAGKSNAQLGKSGEAEIILTMKGQPRGLWVDIDDTLYVADGTAAVRMVPNGQGAGTVRLSFRRPGRFARDTRIKAFVMSGEGTAYALGDEYLFRRSPSGFARLVGVHDPQGLAVSASGDVYVSDTNNNRIVVLTKDMRSQHDLPLPGLWHPKGLAVDSAGILYVADSINRRVIAFNPATGAARILPIKDLYDPSAVAVDANRLVYVADAAFGRAYRFDVRNNEQITLPFGGLLHPRAIAVDRHGAAYVGEAMGYRVVKLSAASR